MHISNQHCVVVAVGVCGNASVLIYLSLLVGCAEVDCDILEMSTFGSYQ